VFKNGTKSAVIKTFSGDSFDHGFNIKSKLKFSFDRFDKSGLRHGTAFIKKASESNKGVN
jgi:hypothetical protein